jgi:hypothetical protein
VGERAAALMSERLAPERATEAVQQVRAGPFSCTRAAGSRPHCGREGTGWASVARLPAGAVLESHTAPLTIGEFFHTRDPELDR